MFGRVRNATSQWFLACRRNSIQKLGTNCFALSCGKQKQNELKVSTVFVVLSFLTFSFSDRLKSMQLLKDIDKSLLQSICKLINTVCIERLRVPIRGPSDQGPV